MAEASKGSAATSSKLHRWVFSPSGPSGHSLFRKARFAGCLFSPFGILSVCGVAKDLYLDKFGADPTTMGLLLVLLTFWGPLNQVVHGALQDRQVLARCFPTETWGRRAPWILTQSFVAAAAACLILVPPGSFGGQGGQGIIHAWFFLMMFFAYFGCTGCLIAFESARQEIYPFKEERIIIEGLCKYACMLGGGAGALPFIVLIADSSLWLRALCTGHLLVVGLASLESVPIFRDARAQVKAGGLFDGFKVLRSVLPGAQAVNDALPHLMALKFWHGAYGASIANMLLYYVTYVLKLGGWERTIVFGGAGAAAGISEAVMNLVYLRLFGTGDDRRDKSGAGDKRLLRVAIITRLANALITVLLIGIATPSVAVLIIWSITSRMALCAFSFWRISAQCWAVDEDCLNNADAGKTQREATIFGTLAMVQNFAGALLGSLTFLGLGIVGGLQTANCGASCAGFEAAAQDASFDLDDCLTSCEVHKINRQPESLALYIRMVIGVWAPLCELVLAYHAYRFPIKGMRLRRLYNKVAERRGPGLPHGGGSADVPLPAPAHTANSKIVLQVDGGMVDMAEHDAAWRERVSYTAHLVNVRPGSKSVSVVFDVGTAGPADDIGAAGGTEAGPEPAAAADEGAVATIAL